MDVPGNSDGSLLTPNSRLVIIEEFEDRTGGASTGDGDRTEETGNRIDPSFG